MDTNQPEPDRLEAIRKFFNGRTIGVDPPYRDVPGQLYWKGPNPDDPTRYLTAQELYELNELVTFLQSS